MRYWIKSQLIGTMAIALLMVAAGLIESMFYHHIFTLWRCIGVMGSSVSGLLLLMLFAVREGFVI